MVNHHSTGNYFENTGRINYQHQSVMTIKPTCVMVHAHSLHVSIVTHHVFCASITSEMCMITGRGVHQLIVSLCDDVKRGVMVREMNLLIFKYIYVIIVIVFVIYTH